MASFNQEEDRNLISPDLKEKTVKRDEAMARRFQKWLATKKGVETPIHKIEAKVLDTLLSSWFMSLRKPCTGEAYEPDTLTNYHRSISRYLKSKGYQEDMQESPLFRNSRRVLTAKRKQAKSEGKGNHPNRSEGLEPYEEEQLWQEGLMGDHSPYILQSGIWFLLSKYCGLKGSDKARRLCWGDLKMTYEGEEPVLVLTERNTDTRPGETEVSEAFVPKMYSDKNHPERCPIRLYNAFKSRRPPTMMSDDSPFFLSVNHGGWENRKGWYKNQALGKNTLNDLMKNMCRAVGLEGRKTNHSLRKATVNTLKQSNTPPAFIQRVSGCKKSGFILNDIQPSEKQHKEVIGILQGKFSKYGDPSNGMPRSSTLVASGSASISQNQRPPSQPIESGKSGEEVEIMEVETIDPEDHDSNGALFDEGQKDQRSHPTSSFRLATYKRHAHAVIPTQGQTATRTNQHMSLRQQPPSQLIESEDSDCEHMIVNTESIDPEDHDSDSSLSDDGQEEVRNSKSSDWNENTIRRDQAMAKRFQKWVATKKGVEKPIHEIEGTVLDNLLSTWFMSLRKPGNGEAYEPDTLTNYHRCISRYLKFKGYQEEIQVSRLFRKSRRVLRVKRKQAKSEGKGNRPKRTECLEPNEVEQLWQKGLMGHHSPYVLQAGIWFLISNNCGFRGCDKARRMRWGDLKLTYEGEEPVLVLTERNTDARPGEDDISVSKIYSDKSHPERSPIHLYNVFKSRRPPTMMSDDCPLFLAVNISGWEIGGEWYKNQALGKNTLNDYNKNMCSVVGLDGRKQPLKKATVNTLRHSNATPAFIQRVSGRVSEKQHKEVKGIQQGKFSKYGDHSNGMPKSSTLAASNCTSVFQNQRPPSQPIESGKSGEEVVTMEIETIDPENNSNGVLLDEGQKDTVTPTQGQAATRTNRHMSLRQQPPSQPIESEDSDCELVIVKTESIDPEDHNSKSSSSDNGQKDQTACPTSSVGVPSAQPPQKGRKVPGKDKGKALQRSHASVRTSIAHTSSEDYEEVVTSHVVRGEKGQSSSLSQEDCDRIAKSLMKQLSKSEGNNFVNCNIHFH